MAITSQIRIPSGFGEVHIADWQAAKLLKPSVIKPVFATIEQTLIIKMLGTLQNADRSPIRAAIKQLFG